MQRSSGILLHISSLPGKEGIGTLGDDAFLFVDMLVEARQSIWQILPLGPTGYGNSPYQCYSAFAGNPLLIDLQLLAEEQLLTQKRITHSVGDHQQINFEEVEAFKMEVLQDAFKVFNENFLHYKEEYYNFLGEHSWWLDDYALFRALKSKYKNKVWNKWDENLKRRNKQSILIASHELAKEIYFHRFLQFIFFRQWYRLKDYANSKGVRMVGDLPLYVSFDSSDVWTNQDIFVLDDDLNPVLVGGVPPDYFSETGQLWGNPVFDWKRLKERNYDWWIARIHFKLRLFDSVRIDHFRGLESFWAVKADAENAIVGDWLPADGYELLKILNKQLGNLNLIAEDLGVITPEVEKLRDDFGLPGMKILQFAFSSDKTNENLPHNYTTNFIVYTGTHDNDTSLGWYQSIDKKEKKKLKRYVSGKGTKFLQNFIELAWSSVAKMAVIPMQDLLFQDTSSRMNIPGTATGNWKWRFSWDQLKVNQKEFLKDITKKYNRNNL